MNLIRKYATRCLHKPPVLTKEYICINGEYLLCGTRIKRKIKYTPFDHHAIVCGTDINNIPWCIEKSTDGIKFVHINDVLDGTEWETIIKEEPQSISYNTIVERAIEYEEPCYSLPNSNCEHFANYILTGCDKSQQSDITVLIGICGLSSVVAWKLNTNIDIRVICVLACAIMFILAIFHITEDYKKLKP